MSGNGTKVGKRLILSDPKHNRFFAGFDSGTSRYYALNISEAELKNALKNDTLPEKNDQKANKSDDELAQDYQLSRAVDLVKALGIYTQQ